MGVPPDTGGAAAREAATGAGAGALDAPRVGYIEITAAFVGERGASARKKKKKSGTPAFSQTKHVAVTAARGFNRAAARGRGLG